MVHQDVLLHGELYHGELPLRAVILKVESDEPVRLPLQPVLVHVEDAVDGQWVVRVDDVDPCVPMGLEAGVEGRHLTVIHGALVGGRHWWQSDRGGGRGLLENRGGR